VYILKNYSVEIYVAKIGFTEFARRLSIIFSQKTLAQASFSVVCFWLVLSDALTFLEL
jgi:hypothetical protein